MANARKHRPTAFVSLAAFVAVFAAVSTLTATADLNALLSGASMSGQRTSPPALQTNPECPGQLAQCENDLFVCQSAPMPMHGGCEMEESLLESIRSLLDRFESGWISMRRDTLTAAILKDPCLAQLATCESDLAACQSAPPAAVDCSEEDAAIGTIDSLTTWTSTIPPDEPFGVLPVDDPVWRAVSIGSPPPPGPPAPPTPPPTGTPSILVTETDDSGVSPANPTVVIYGGGGMFGPTDTYEVVLSGAPLTGGNVTISPMIAPPGSVSGPWATFSPSSLVFTPATWNVPQKITLTAKPMTPGVLEPSPTLDRVFHTVSAAGTNYFAATAADVYSLFGNKASWAYISPVSLSATEGGAGATLSVNLRYPPTQPVTVSLSQPGFAQLTFDPISVVFDPSNWQTPQTFTIGAIADGIAEPSPHSGLLKLDALSDDPNYSGNPSMPVNVSITDGSAPGVPGVIFNPNPPTISVSETTGAPLSTGTSASYDIRLTSQPAPGQVVSVNTISPGLRIAANPMTVNFGTADWNIFKTVTVNAINDDDVNGSATLAIAHSVTSGDAAYDGIFVPPVSVTVADNDAGIIVSESAGSTSVTKGGAPDEFTVKLSADPGGAVLVVMSAPSGKLTVPPSIAFDSSNWDTPITVSVTAVDNGITEGSQVIPIDLSASGHAPARVNTTILDNPNSLVFMHTSGSTYVTETWWCGLFQCSDIYMVKLSSPPSAPVTLSITHQPPLAPAPNPGPRLIISPIGSLTFDASNWNTPRSIGITVIDDFWRGPNTVTLKHSIPGYASANFVVGYFEND